MSALPSSNTLDAALGSALRDIRKSHSLTARALSQKSGISAAMISRLERGHASASMATLNALSQALNVPLRSSWGRRVHGSLLIIVKLHRRK